MRATRPALAVTAALLLAGCTDAKSPSVANVGTTTTATRSTTSASVAAADQSQLQQDALKYSRCMRTNGVPAFPDPGSGGGFTYQVGGGIDPSSPSFTAAQAKCHGLMPAGPAPPGSTTHPSAHWLARMVKAAECMRRHGVPEFPDPRTSVPANPFPAGLSGGVISNIEGVIFIFPASLGIQSPVFIRAANECGFPLHNH
jgi:hypothetical protein